MKKKLVFWKNITGDPVMDGFSRNPEYHAFFEKCNHAFDFRFALGKTAYLGKSEFSDVFVYHAGRILPTGKKFKADVIYQFKKVADESFDHAVPIVNTLEFKTWCADKWQQYQLLGDLMPKTFLIEKEDDLEKYLPQISSAKAVLKPRRGQKGEDVVVFAKEQMPKLDSGILSTKGYLLQEFHNTNVEVPGIVSGVHDIKLITIDDQVFANLRTPERDGGEVCTFDSPYTEIAFNKLPSNVLVFHKQAKERIDGMFPGQLYTIDIGITDKGPIIFELNGHTAFPYIHFEYAQDFFDALIKHLQLMK